MLQFVITSSVLKSSGTAKQCNRLESSVSPTSIMLSDGSDKISIASQLHVPPMLISMGSQNFEARIPAHAV